MQTLDAMDSKKRAFPELLQKHFGLITPTCKEIGISRQTYYNWREADPVFAKECDECVETTCDFVENRLMDCIASGDTTAIIFYCKTKMKKRGFVERMETTGADGGAIKQEIDIVATKEQKDALVRMLNDK